MTGIIKHPINWLLLTLKNTGSVPIIVEIKSINNPIGPETIATNKTINIETIIPIFL